MARIRTIKPEFFTSEDIVELAPLARLLYVALWCEADKEGRLVWKPRTFKMRYLPGDDCDIDALCDALVTRGVVVLYGQGLAYIPGFKSHQHINPREKDSDLPSPDDASSRVTDASERVQTQSVTRREEGKGREGKGNIDRRVEDASDEKPIEKKSRKGNATPLPSPYPMPTQIDTFATERGFSMTEKAREHERFCNHAYQNDRRCVDWIAAERNWFIGSAERSGKQPPLPAGAPVSDGLIEVLGEEELQAWDEYGRKKCGKSFPRNSRGGWRFPTRWPPGYQPPERTLEVPPLRINPMQPPHTTGQ